MYTLLIIYWLLFGVLHSVLAAEWCKVYVRRLLGTYFKYYRFGYSVIALLTLTLILLYHFSLPAILIWKPPVFLTVLFGITGIIGVVIMLICMWQYFFYLSGIDVFYPRRSMTAKLETSGLHRYVRHPLYFGTLLMLWSVFFLFPGWTNLITCAMITGYTWIGAVLEEQKLKKEFGELYGRYQQEVPMLIPFLKGCRRMEATPRNSGSVIRKT